MPERVPAGSRDYNWRPTAILRRQIWKRARSAGVGPGPKGIRAGLDNKMRLLHRQLCSHVEDEVSPKVASVVVNRRTPVKSVVVMRRGPIDIKIDVDLGEVPTRRKCRAVSTPIGVRTAGRATETRSPR